MLILDDVRAPPLLPMKSSFESLAQHGTAFTNAHAAGTSCGPSRVSLLTGRWPSIDHRNGTGVCTNKQARTFTQRQQHVTLPALLKAQGYHVAGAGKVFHQDSCEFGTRSDGTFDEYFHSLPEHRPDGSTAAYVCSGVTERDDVAQGPMPEPDKRFCECANHGRLDLASTLRAKDPPFAGLVWNASAVMPLPDARVASWATAFLARAASRHSADPKPFFLAVGLHAAHAPYVVADHAAVAAAEALFAGGSWPLNMSEAESDLAALPLEGRAIAAGRHAAIRTPAEDVATYEEQRKEWLSEQNQRRTRQAITGYAARLAETDARVGSILDALRSAPTLARSTIVMLTADHGTHLGEKAVAVGSKWTLWERTSRVPFYLHIPPSLLRSLPRGTPGGSTVSSAVSLVDVVPTLAEACGVEHSALQRLPGRSLLPLLGEHPAAVASARDRSVLVTHCPSRTVLGYAVRDARWRYVSYASKAKGSPAGHGWTSAEEAAGAGAELYDLMVDPAERFNLLRDARARPDVRQQWATMERSLQRLLVPAGTGLGVSASPLALMRYA